MLRYETVRPCVEEVFTTGNPRRHVATITAKAQGYDVFVPYDCETEHFDHRDEAEAFIKELACHTPECPNAPTSRVTIQYDGKTQVFTTCAEHYAFAAPAKAIVTREAI